MAVPLNQDAAGRGLADAMEADGSQYAVVYLGQAKVAEQAVVFRRAIVGRRRGRGSIRLANGGHDAVFN